jgi:cyclopropane-fatty-acyl-phospholipid synthase
MRQEQAGPSGKSFVGDNDYLPPGHRGTLGYLSVATLKALVTRWLRAIGYPPVQIVLWNGQEISGDEMNPSARLLIPDPGALLKLVIDPALYFGELYTAGRIEVQGRLLDFLEVVYRTWPYRQDMTVKKLLAPFYDARRNTLSGARRNIHHHYDIGNDFYKLWLDENMVYTCAYFQNPDASLEDAQFAELDHVCRKLCLRPGEAVVEAGCGWGALALPGDDRGGEWHRQLRNPARSTWSRSPEPAVARPAHQAVALRGRRRRH